MEKKKVNVVRDRNNANTGRTPGTNYPMESERDFQKRTQFYKYRARVRMMEQDANTPAYAAIPAMSRAEREKTRVRKMKQAMRSRIAEISAAEREKRRQESVIAYAARRRAYAEKMKEASPGGNPNEAK